MVSFDLDGTCGGFLRGLQYPDLNTKSLTGNRYLTGIEWFLYPPCCCFSRRRKKILSMIEELQQLTAKKTFKIIQHHLLSSAHNTLALHCFDSNRSNFSTKYLSVSLVINQNLSEDQLTLDFRKKKVTIFSSPPLDQ